MRIYWSAFETILKFHFTHIFFKTSIFQIGLDTLALFCKKKSYGTRINNKLYCSQITKQFVLKKYPLFPEKVLNKLIFLVDSVESNCTTCSLTQRHFSDIWSGITKRIIHIAASQFPSCRPLLLFSQVSPGPSTCTTAATSTSCAPPPSPPTTAPAPSCSSSRDWMMRSVSNKPHFDVFHFILNRVRWSDVFYTLETSGWTIPWCLHNLSGWAFI